MEHKIELNRVYPTTALFFTSMHCERQTAIIRHHTVSSMEDNDIRSVAYRYLQNAQGEIATRNQIFAFASFAIYGIFYFMFHLPSKLITVENPTEEDMQSIRLPLLILCLAYEAIFLPNLPPNICNTLRYRESKNACADWLIQQIGDENFQQIKKLPYNKDSFFKINDILDKKNTPKALPDNVPSQFKRL